MNRQSSYGVKLAGNSPPEFPPTFIPQNKSDFAKELAQRYKCLTGTFTLDCCQRTCGLNSNSTSAREVEYVNPAWYNAAKYIKYY